MQYIKKYYRITAVNILERNDCNMKKKWLSLALAILMLFALIPQAALPVLAEEEIALDQIEAEIPTDQVNEKVPADGNE